jgi:hypothetical protein
MTTPYFKWTWHTETLEKKIGDMPTSGLQACRTASFLGHKVNLERVGRTPNHGENKSAFAHRGPDEKLKCHTRDGILRAAGAGVWRFPVGAS